MLNSILASYNARSLVKSIFNSDNFIKYVKPGYELGLEIKIKLQKLVKSTKQFRVLFTKSWFNTYWRRCRCYN